MAFCGLLSPFFSRYFNILQGNYLVIKLFENLFKPRQRRLVVYMWLTSSVLSTTSTQCFEQPVASFLVCSLIFIEYKVHFKRPRMHMKLCILGLLFCIYLIFQSTIYFSRPGNGYQSITGWGVPWFPFLLEWEIELGQRDDECVR